MSVPFERLGPGQVGRLVYQVIGSNGPISNPDRIRYLAAPPDGSSSSLLSPMAPSSLGAFAGYAQMANLGISVANLGVSIATLVEVRKMSKAVREIQAGVRTLNESMQEVVARTRRIDINTAEPLLADAIEYGLRSALVADGFDLGILASHMRKAVTRFQESTGTQSLGSGIHFELAPKVADSLKASLDVLWSARQAAICSHNLSVGGDPRAVAADGQLAPEVVRLAELTAALAMVQRNTRRAGDRLGDSLKGRVFAWFESGPYRKMITDDLPNQNIAAFTQLSATEPVLGLLGLFETESDVADINELVTLIQRYLTEWLTRTDAGLLWMLRRECELQSDAQYWKALSSWAKPLAGTSNGIEGVIDPEIGVRELAPSAKVCS